MQKILLLLYKIKVWILTYFYVFYPNMGTYNKLYRYKNIFSVNNYIKIRNRIFSKSEKNIQKKEHKSIRIIMVDCSEWATTEIYDYFHNKGLDVAVVLAPFFHGTSESIKKAYSLCRDFCKSRRIQYLDLYDTESWTLRPAHHEIYGDIMIYTNPWMGTYPEELKVKNISLSCITCYIPYGFMLLKHEHNQFNQLSHNMFTHIYCETKIHWQMYDKYCDIGNSHVEYAGYPKLDWYLTDKTIDDKAIWKGLSEDFHKIKIIYSPHWILNETGTFMDNGLQILRFAEEHAQTTSWIYKPHPLLEKEVIVQGYMTAQEYQEYVESWNRLPNARVYLLGDYGDIFLSSDCIINDSVSFIAEYMYTHKPMLLLSNGVARYNDFGEECNKHVYICDSKNFQGIQKFIENIIAGKDEMKPDREQFFSEYLDYYGYHNKNASEYVISRISKILGLKQGDD